MSGGTDPSPRLARRGALLHLKVGDHRYSKKVAEGDTQPILRGIELPAGPMRLEAWIADGDSVRGLRFMEVRKLD